MGSMGVIFPTKTCNSVTGHHRLYRLTLVGLLTVMFLQKNIQGFHQFSQRLLILYYSNHLSFLSIFSFSIKNQLTQNQILIWQGFGQSETHPQHHFYRCNEILHLLDLQFTIYIYLYIIQIHLYRDIILTEVYQSVMLNTYMLKQLVIEETTIQQSDKKCPPAFLIALKLCFLLSA